MSEEMTWITIEFLTTLTGAVFVTNIITHFIKDYFSEVLDRKILTLIVACIVVFLNQIVFGAVNGKAFYLAAINSFLVATAAMGNYEILTNKMQKRLMKEAASSQQDEVTLQGSELQQLLERHSKDKSGE